MKISKFFIATSLISIIFSFGPAWSKPLSPLVGNYDVTVESIKAVVAYEVESVWTLSNEGKERLEYLKDQYNASCSHIQRSLYRCQRSLDLNEIPSNIEERLVNNWAYSKIHFWPATKSEILFEGEVVKEYLVEQIGEFEIKGQQQTFQEWRYFFGEAELEKVQAGSRSPSPYSFIRNNNQLNLILSESTTLDRFRFQVWVVSIPFIKN